MEREIKPTHSRLILFTSVFVPVLAIIVNIAIPIIQKDNKALSWEIISISDIIDTQYPVSKDIEVSYLGKRLEALFVVNLRVINSGNVPIKKDDFEKKLRFDFGVKSNILRAGILAKRPPSLMPKIAFADNMVEIDPLLMNPGDSFGVQALISGVKHVPVLDTRIVGLKEPKTILTESLLPLQISVRTLYILVFLLWFVAGIQLSILINMVRRPRIKYRFTTKVCQAIITSIMVFVGFYFNTQLYRTYATPFSLINFIITLVAWEAGFVFHILQFPEGYKKRVTAAKS
jgi:hypothetical protein